MSETKSEYLLTSEVARLKNRTPATIRQWERQGKLRAIRTESGVRLFSRTDVEALKIGTRS